MKKTTSIVFILFLCAQLFAQQVAKLINTPNGQIGFLQYSPSNIVQKSALIIFLHGIGERGNGTTDLQNVIVNGIPSYCSKNSFPYQYYVLSPQLDKQQGNWPTWYVDAMIEYAIANLNIDTNRIYLTGLSLGGGGTWRYSTNGKYRFKIAAYAPVCGTDEADHTKQCDLPAKGIGLWAFHCMGDPVVGVGNTQKSELTMNACKAQTTRFTYYRDGGHTEAWLNAYDTGHITRALSDGTLFTAQPNLYEWMFSFNRSLPPPVLAPILIIKAYVADAGKDTTVTVSEVYLNGSNSFGYGSFGWEAIARPAGAGNPWFDNGRSDDQIIKRAYNLADGLWTFKLTVWPKVGSLVSDTVNITVNTKGVPVPIPVPPTKTIIARLFVGGMQITVYSDKTVDVQ